MKQKIDKERLIDHLVVFCKDGMDYDEMIIGLIEMYDCRGHKNLDWLLYDLIEAGYGVDELDKYGWQDWEIERMSNRVMRGDGPE
jgi:hypothetical protein